MKRQQMNSNKGGQVEMVTVTNTSTNTKVLIPSGTWLPCQHVKQMVLNFRLGTYIPSKIALLIAFGHKKLTIFNNANSKLMHQHHTLL